MRLLFDEGVLRPISVPNDSISAPFLNLLICENGMVLGQILNKILNKIWCVSYLPEIAREVKGKTEFQRQLQKE